MHNTVVILMIVVACVLCVLFGAANFASKTKILVETPLYASPNFNGEISLEKLLQNESVEIIGEEIRDAAGNGWYRIRYNSYAGYVPSGYVFFTPGNDDYNVIVSKVTATQMSEEICIYAYYDESSEVVGKLSDGEKVDIVLDQYDYGAFSKIVYNNGYYFIKTKNVTTGLTYNQKIALIIVAILIVILIVGCVMAVMLYKKKKRSVKPVDNNENEAKNRI